MNGKVKYNKAYRAARKVRLYRTYMRHHSGGWRKAQRGKK
jgi:hypothetical protein